MRFEHDSALLYIPPVLRYNNNQPPRPPTSSIHNTHTHTQRHAHLWSVYVIRSCLASKIYRSSNLAYYILYNVLYLCMFWKTVMTRSYIVVVHTAHSDVKGDDDVETNIPDPIYTICMYTRGAHSILCSHVMTYMWMWSTCMRPRPWPTLCIAYRFFVRSVHELTSSSDPLHIAWYFTYSVNAFTR